MSMFGRFDGLFFFVFGLVFVLILGIFIFEIVKGISTKKKNDHSPRLSVNATVVSKRTNTSGMDHTSTTYYVTF